MLLRIIPHIHLAGHVLVPDEVAVAAVAALEDNRLNNWTSCCWWAGSGRCCGLAFCRQNDLTTGLVLLQTYQIIFKGRTDTSQYQSIFRGRNVTPVRMITFRDLTRTPAFPKIFRDGQVLPHSCSSLGIILVLLHS